MTRFKCFSRHIFSIRTFEYLSFFYLPGVVDPDQFQDIATHITSAYKCIHLPSLLKLNSNNRKLYIYSNNVSKSNRSPPNDFNRLSPPSGKRSRYQRERSRSPMDRNGHRSSNRQTSLTRVAMTDIRRKNLVNSRLVN